MINGRHRADRSNCFGLTEQFMRMVLWCLSKWILGYVDSCCCVGSPLRHVAAGDGEASH
jgi:hypothetical protein